MADITDEMVNAGAASPQLQALIADAGLRRDIALEILEAVAPMIAAKARDEAARICDDAEKSSEARGDLKRAEGWEEAAAFSYAQAATARNLAAAIRALRGGK